MTIELTAGTYGVLMALAPILQARRIRARRSSADVSIVYMAVLEIGFALYLAYGISIGNRVLIATNTVSLVATSITLSIALTYRQPKPSD
jgi:MtN3 and saliva related transmembrane protein